MENLRKLAAAFEAADDWPREGEIWQDLLKRSEQGHGQALDFNARAIGIITAIPDGTPRLDNLLQERKSIERERAADVRH